MSFNIPVKTVKNYKCHVCNTRVRVAASSPPWCLCQPDCPTRMTSDLIQAIWDLYTSIAKHK
jgi:hypothetical protein